MDNTYAPFGMSKGGLIDAKHQAHINAGSGLNKPNSQLGDRLEVIASNARRLIVLLTGAVEVLQGPTPEVSGAKGDPIRPSGVLHTLDDIIAAQAQALETAERIRGIVG